MAVVLGTKRPGPAEHRPIPATDPDARKRPCRALDATRRGGRLDCDPSLA